MVNAEIQDYLDSGIISGKAYSELIRNEIKEEISKLDPKPFLATIIVGEDPASEIYVKFKEKACNQVGIGNEIFKLPANITQIDLLSHINKLNQDPNVDGILLQLPLSSHLNEVEATMTISSDKDVDGLHYVNVGKLQLGMDGFVPCTPNGIIYMLEKSNVKLKGKYAVIIGRSNLVGKPMIRLLESRHATVTVCHSRTINLTEITQKADIIIAAVGKANILTADMVKDGVVVIDVGMNRIDGKLVGDVDFEKVKKKASLITPVPGGVGPMTISMLLWNTLKAFKMTRK